MERLFSKINKWKYIIIPIVVIGAIGFGLKGAGTYLVKQSEQLQRSDAALILMGGLADRVLHGADLFLQEKTDEIFMVNSFQDGSEELAKHHVRISNSANLSVDALIQLKVPDSLITIIPGEAKTTMEEALISAVWLKEHPEIRSLTIVSSAYHTRRSFIIFRDQYRKKGLDVELYVSPSHYSGFNAKRWWTDEESAKQVFMEYLKLCRYLLYLRWK